MHVFNSLDEDIEDFAADYGGNVEFIRLVVTPEQAALYALPSAPPKPTDKPPATARNLPRPRRSLRALEGFWRRNTPKRSFDGVCHQQN